VLTLGEICKIRSDPDIYGLRDRDFLLDSEVDRIKKKYIKGGFPGARHSKNHGKERLGNLSENISPDACEWQ
jgi:hypothetical protein